MTRGDAERLQQRGVHGCQQVEEVVIGGVVARRINRWIKRRSPRCDDCPGRGRMFDVVDDKERMSEAVAGREIDDQENDQQGPAEKKARCRGEAGAVSQRAQQTWRAERCDGENAADHRPDARAAGEIEQDGQASEAAEERQAEALDAPCAAKARHGQRRGKKAAGRDDQKREDESGEERRGELPEQEWHARASVREQSQEFRIRPMGSSAARIFPGADSSWRGRADRLRGLVARDLRSRAAIVLRRRHRDVWLGQRPEKRRPNSV